ncbi:MAG: glutathione synthase [Alphaproteobacteria bacterium TMED87]|nr:glutathione synthase [Rhodospirillaceae bacterium]OUV10416.1 MAG: glutathione synthase [Alphaproteobacteria bacterium TMED87]
MSLSVAIQMDPVESIDLQCDSTYLIALEAKKRNYRLFHYTPSSLSLRNNKLIARANVLRINYNNHKNILLGEQTYIDLEDMDIVLMRQDPPFNMSYITATYLLEKITNKTLVINDPTGVRNSPEKLLVTNFKDFIPSTLISSDFNEIKNFRSLYKDIIVKPLYGNGGSGVFHLTADDENLSSLIEFFTSFSQEPLIVQEYIPEVRLGDKRIILIDGHPIGAINRIPPKGEARSNMHVGGQAEKIELNDVDKSICEAIGDELRNRGLFFAGIDVIGNFLTEINVTSPTGIQEINRFDGIQVEKLFWNNLEKKI